MTLASLAARNALRNRVRSSLTIIGVALAVLTALFLRTAVAAWSIGADRAPKNRLVTRNQVAFELGLPKRYVEEVRAIPGVQQVSWLSWFGGSDPNRPSQSLSSYACDPTTFLQVFDGISIPTADRERWQSDRTGALIGSALAERMGLRVGDHITLTGTVYPGSWEFNIDAIYTPTSAVADPGLFLMHWNYINEARVTHMHDRVEYIWSRVASAEAAATVGRAIDQHFEQGETPTRTEDERSFFSSMLGMVRTVLRALDAISLAVIGIMLLLIRNTMSMAVDERVAELSAMRALGFGERRLTQLVVLEAVFLGAIGAFLGVVLAFPMIDWWIGRWVESTLAALLPEFRLQPLSALWLLAIALAGSAFVTLWTARRVVRLPLAQALRQVA